MSEASNVIRFPTQLRIVPLEPPAPGADDGVQLVDHDGRLYALHRLLTRLPVAVRDELAIAMPRTGQEAWDLIVRRWPEVATRIVADVPAAS